jgi:acyl-CoA reductase-like NAD-dependent aldehyde dehydrogenase
MVGRAVADGANLRCGGARAAIPAYPEGNFYQPTILDGCKPDSEIVQEEVFGPVAVVSSFETLEEAVALANASRFGLAAGIWTSSLRTAHLCAKQVRAGTVWVNTYRAIASQSPFGGMKDSGYGRQNGIDAVFQYLQSKSVWCELSEDISDPFIMKL